MAKITRVTQRTFGLSGAAGDFGVFGSKAAASPTNSQDPATIQSLSAFLSGWASAVTAGETPTLEEENGLFLLLFFGTILLRQYYTWNMPSSPQPAMKRVIPMSANYEKIVYISKHEKIVMNSVYAIMGLVGMLYVIGWIKGLKSHEK